MGSIKSNVHIKQQFCNLPCVLRCSPSCGGWWEGNLSPLPDRRSRAQRAFQPLKSAHFEGLRAYCKLPQVRRELIAAIASFALFKVGCQRPTCAVLTPCCAGCRATQVSSRTQKGRTATKWCVLTCQPRRGRKLATVQRVCTQWPGFSMQMT